MDGETNAIEESQITQTRPIEMPKTPTILIGGDAMSKDHYLLENSVNPVGSVDSCPPEVGLSVNTSAAHLKRAPSETTVSFSTEGVQWERSQSEANLSVLKSEVEAAISSLGGCIDEEVVANASTGNMARSKGLVSEQARVYWNLPEAVNEEHATNGVVSTTNVSGNTMSPLPSAGGVSMSSLNNCGLDMGNNGSIGGMYIHPRGSISSEPARSTTHLSLDDSMDEKTDNRGRLPSGQIACTLNTIPQQEELETMHYNQQTHMNDNNMPCLSNTLIEQYEVSRSLPEAINLSGRSCGMSSFEYLVSSITTTDNCTKATDCVKTSIMSVEGTPNQNYSFVDGGTTSLLGCPVMSLPSAPNQCNVKTSSQNVDNWDAYQALSVANRPPSSNSSYFPQLSPTSTSDTHTHIPSVLLRGWSGIEGFNSSAQELPSLVPSISGSVLTNFAQHIKNVVKHRENLLLLSKVVSLNEVNFMEFQSVDDCLQNMDSCIEQLEKAWQMPQHGRDVAIAMCSCVREEGLLDVLAQMSANIGQLIVKTTDTDSDRSQLHQHLFQLLRRACHLLSQVLTKVNCSLLLQMIHPLSRASTSNPPTTMEDKSVIEQIVNCAWIVRKQPQWSREFVAILSGVLKQHSSTCDLVLQYDGLRVLTFACRSLDVPTLRHTVLALTNLALYARGAHIVEQMARGGVAHWLFPAAMHADPVARYYACLCIAVLWTLATTPGSCLMTRGVHIQSTHTTSTTNTNINNSEANHTREEKARLLASSWSAGGWCGTGTQAAQLLAQEVQRSGTLNLVRPFIRSHAPIDFAHQDLFYFHSRSKGWLQRLLPVLACEREEVQALAAFHFALEARVKVNQRRASLFQEIGALPLLLEVAGSSHYLAAQFAADALQYLGETVPPRLCPDVALWRESDVLAWLNRVGFSDLCSAFQESRVDGDALLCLDEQMLKNDLHLNNGILRQRFLRELIRLKCGCSYSSVDNTGLSQWLRVHLGLHYVQYTYPLIRAGVDRLSLPQLLFCSNDHILAHDCAITNGLHRAKFLALLNDCVFPDKQHSLDRLLSMGNIFISYRRNGGGSHLASILRVHLQLCGYNVLMDIESLCAGQYPSPVLHNISISRYFLLVLTPDAFTACQRDEACHDFIHKEIAYALKKKCKVIPVIHNFQWPPDQSLPQNICEITSLDAIKWDYDNQDACIDQIQNIMFDNSKHDLNTCELPQPCLSGEFLQNPSQTQSSCVFSQTAYLS